MRYVRRFYYNHCYSNRDRATILAAVMAVGLLVAASTGQETGQLENKLRKSTKQLTDHQYLLQYKFKAGESLFYEVVHQTAVETTVDGNTQEMKSRSKSLKKWEFSKVDSDGNGTFTHSVDYVNMWSETDGRQPLRYDSRTDEKPPADYKSVAENINKPISTVKASIFGKIIERSDAVKQIDRGTGGLLIPLPPRPIPVGTEWALPSEVQVTLGDGRQQAIKTRKRFVLEKVESGVATIVLETQVLTPVSEARVRSQLIQKLSKGVIKFDVDAGRVLSKTLDWDETVIGFNGPESNMAFLAQMTERLVPQDEVASLREPPR